MPEGIETRVYSSNGLEFEHHHLGAVAHECIEFLRAHAGCAAVVLDEFAEGLARHVHAGEGHEAGQLPGGDAAIETGKVAIAGARQHRGGARGETIVVVDEHDARCLARHQPREAQLEPAQRDIARPQQMVLREGEFLAHIDQRQLLVVAEHGLDGGGGEGTER